MSWIIALAAFSVTAGPDSRIDAREFQQAFEAARAGRFERSESTARQATRYRYVFVYGFWNEAVSGYFSQNVKELKRYGVPGSHIHHIKPSSHRLLDDNADEVKAAFEEIVAAGPEPLVVIAHSRGACDSLAFALRSPDFVEEHVEALFLIQGPFGGTPLADHVQGDPPPRDGKVGPVHETMLTLMAKAERRKLDRGDHGGLVELGRSSSLAFWSEELKEHVDAIPVVSSRVLFVTAQADGAPRRQPFRRALGRLLSASVGENDGIVALEDQSIGGLGATVAVFDAGHNDLTGRFPAARPERRLRKALIDAILASLTRPDIQIRGTNPTARRDRSIR